MARGGIPVVLSSATPSIESLVNVERGRYRHIRLATRYKAAGLPALQAIDMRESPPERGHWLSPVLIEEMADTLARGEQALLFLNRRGYAPVTLCRKCGFRFECPNCSAWLVEHRFRRRLECHHCGKFMPIPHECPSCGAEDSLVACGPGIERIAEEVAEHFPEARRALLSSDLTPSIADCARPCARSRTARSTSSSAPSSWPKAIIFRGLPWSAWSTRISASPKATPAPPSAPSSS